MDAYEAGGDVHANSGIPNYAFYVVATTLGGHAWDAAGRMWYAACSDPNLRSDATFTDFARLTLKHAQQTYGVSSNQEQAVRSGWDAAKVPL
jgi:Zn-dependent metalloprotease